MRTVEEGTDEYANITAYLAYARQDIHVDCTTALLLDQGLAQRSD